MMLSLSGVTWAGRLYLIGCENATLVYCTTQILRCARELTRTLSRGNLSCRQLRITGIQQHPPVQNSKHRTQSAKARAYLFDPWRSYWWRLS